MLDYFISARKSSHSQAELKKHSCNCQDDQQGGQFPFPARLPEFLGSLSIQVIITLRDLSEYLTPYHSLEHACVPTPNLLKGLGSLRRNRSSFLEAPEVLVLFGDNKC